MKISKSHQRFANRLRNQRALDHPEEFLGPNWKDVLNFWFFMDTLNEEQRKSIRDAYYSLRQNERRLASEAAAAAAAAAGDAAFDIAWVAVWLAYGYVASYVAADTTNELIGSHILQEQGKSLVFLPLFLNI